MDTDEKYMSRCIDLAEKGAGRVAPNPLVGAVLVYRDRIIGEGWHQVYGQSHAEVNCINSVMPDDLRHIPESTLYVSLEPCAHFGKTPPCADLVIQKGIRKVVIGCRDPFPLVDGKGIEKMLSAGIEVKSGVLEAGCRSLNKRFFTYHQQQRPYVILKWAQSANGYIGSGGSERLHISNAYSNTLVHKWRSEEAAIAVGTTTALLDNPSLTTRYWPGAHPRRVVLDMQLKLPLSNAVFSDEAGTIILNEQKSGTEGHLHYVKISGHAPMAQQVLEELHKQQLLSVIIEGGATFLQEFISEGLWDEARIITNNELLIQGGRQAPVLQNGRFTGSMQLLNDTIAFYSNG